MQKLKDHHIYAIARIPAFRDAWLAEAQPDWCVKKADGTVFQDRDNHAWVNPYKEEAWEYLAEIALEAQKLGFDEIQFDYVRFCTEKMRYFRRRIPRAAAGPRRSSTLWNMSMRN